MSEHFFQSLNYSAAHEDGASELRALALGPTDRVVCIAGSGARPLELLLGNPKEVLAIDMNPAQLALLELKIAGIRSLGYAEFLAFIGVNHCDTRRRTFGNLRTQLSMEAQTYWDAHVRDLDRGVIYAGSWDKRLRLFAKLFSIVRGGLRDRLFRCADVREQADLWRRHWDNRTWDLLLRAIFSRTLWRRFSTEPGAALVSDSTDVPAYLKQCFRQAASSFLFRQSAWAWLAFYGRYRADEAVPLYLREVNYSQIRDRLDRLRLVRAPLTSFLESAGGIDAFSISDVSSYMTEPQHQACWRAMFKSANVGARVCERRFLVRYETEWATAHGWHRDAPMESLLDANDQSVVYDFVCGTLHKGDSCARRG